MSVEETHSNQNPWSDQAARIQRIALIVGGAGVLVSALLIPVLGLRQFLGSYLMAYLYALGLTLGCISLLLLNHTAGGTWGLILRRPLEAGAATIPLMTLLFLPLALGASTLYPWGHLAPHDEPATAEAEPHDEHQADHHDEIEYLSIKGHKDFYFQMPFYYGRMIFYFAVWNLLAWLLLKWSSAQDQSIDPTPTYRSRLLGPPGLILLFLAATFAMIDWVMSLEPMWYSTIYGAMLIVGQGLQTFAFTIIVTSLLYERGELKLVTPVRLRDLGNLLLAFVMLWAYTAYSQFIIIWTGNLSEEVPWYLRRTEGGWQYVAMFLVLFHFFLPFFVLLFRSNKENTRPLRWIAGWILLVHVIDIWWLVAPGLGYRSVGISLIDPAAMVGVGGLWLAAYTYFIRRKPLVAVNDPAVLELAAYDAEQAHSHPGGA